MISGRVYKSAGKMKNIHVSHRGGQHTQLSGPSIFRLMRKYPGDEITIIDKRTGVDETMLRLFNILVVQQNFSKTKINLKEPIRHGGFVKYIRYLEFLKKGLENE